MAAGDEDEVSESAVVAVDGTEIELKSMNPAICRVQLATW